MSGHTPGPWRFSLPKRIGHLPQDPDVYHDLRGPEDECILFPFGYEVEGIEVPIVADARLIASAPDLLAALEAALPHIELVGLAEQARAAVKKARGET